MTSLICLAIKSINWFTRNEGGMAWTPPAGILMSSLQMGHLNIESMMSSDNLCF